MTFVFDRETALVSRGDGSLYIEASEIYRNPTGAAFGGWVAAIMTKAVQDHEECSGPVVSVQTTFIAGVGPGEVNVTVRLLKSGASTQFWRVELSQTVGIVAVSDIVSSNRRPTDLNYQIPMPVAKPASESPTLRQGEDNPPFWVSTYEQKIARGVPFSVNENPESLVWIKETDGRPLDRLNIVSICDTPMPRTFFLSDELRMGATVSMGTYIYASEEDIAAAGSDYLLLRVDGATSRNSATDQRVELWSQNGTLLATSNQIGFFR
ncbi:thioesterase family protein [Parasphingorhabdus sp. JC815]|uniref:acyl-CoA thioesterase n=1 Tax=Parasphingorhabdus sp. JC815 TaxID=3232140 RepID=UPI00345AD46C